MDNKIKKILSVLFVTMFVVTLTASAVSAERVNVDVGIRDSINVMNSDVHSGDASTTTAGGVYAAAGARVGGEYIRSGINTVSDADARSGDVVVSAR